MFRANSAITWSAFRRITAWPNSPSLPRIEASVWIASSVCSGPSEVRSIVALALTVDAIRFSAAETFICERRFSRSRSTTTTRPWRRTPIGPTLIFSAPSNVSSSIASNDSTPGTHRLTAGMSIMNSQTRSTGAAIVTR
jgi:hypothetical protein